MGDAILATALLNTLRHNFPEARIDFVLNESIAPLFSGHPSIDRILTFSDDERHRPLTYLKKVWSIVHHTRYDVIIDMRSTVNTMLFALLSPRTPYRIGVKKGYTALAFNHPVGHCGNSRSMVDYDTQFAQPLSKLRPIQPSTGLPSPLRKKRSRHSAPTSKARASTCRSPSCSSTSQPS